MDKRKLRRTFRMVQKETKMDYAIIDTDDYGDCKTCVNSELANIFGIDSTGIYLKHWESGMNADRPIKYQEDLYIGHDITEEQAVKMIEIFRRKGYMISPDHYDKKMCFKIMEVQNA